MSKHINVEMSQWLSTFIAVLSPTICRAGPEFTAVQYCTSDVGESANISGSIWYIVAGWAGSSYGPLKVEKYDGVSI